MPLSTAYSVAEAFEQRCDLNDSFRQAPVFYSAYGVSVVVAITFVLIAAGVATIGYLSALSVGPASIIVPFVATSPSLGGLAGIAFLREGATRRQLAGIALGLAAIVLLAREP